MCHRGMWLPGYRTRIEARCKHSRFEVIRERGLAPTQDPLNEAVSSTDRETLWERAPARESEPIALAINRRAWFAFHDADHGDGRPAETGGARTKSSRA